MLEILTKNELLLTKSPEILTFCESFRHSEDLRNRADRAKRRGTMQIFYPILYFFYFIICLLYVLKNVALESHFLELPGWFK